MHLARGSFVLPVVLIAFMACASSDTVTGARSLQPHAPSRQYLDSASYVESGGELSGGFGGTVSGAFYNSNADFTASAPIWWQTVTDVSVTVTATVKKNSDNSTVNSAVKSASKNGWVPMGRFDTTVTVTASTMNRTCGITGKSNVSGSAALHLLRVDFTVTTPWQTSLNTDGTDVTLADCPPINDTQSSPSPCPGQLIYDPETCGEGGGGSGGSGYDPDNGCTYYLITPVISYDGGQTWYVNGSSWIEQVC
jgi:hypothetical protein